MREKKFCTMKFQFYRVTDTIRRHKQEDIMNLEIVKAAKWSRWSPGKSSSWGEVKRNDSWVRRQVGNRKEDTALQLSPVFLLCNGQSTQILWKTIKPPLWKWKNPSALNSELVYIICPINIELFDIESSIIEKMLLHNIPYSQNQSNQIYSQTGNTSEKGKVCEICGNLLKVIYCRWN